MIQSNFSAVSRTPHPRCWGLLGSGIAPPSRCAVAAILCARTRAPPCTHPIAKCVSATFASVTLALAWVEVCRTSPGVDRLYPTETARPHGSPILRNFPDPCRNQILLDHQLIPRGSLMLVAIYKQFLPLSPLIFRPRSFGTMSLNAPAGTLGTCTLANAVSYCNIACRMGTKSYPGAASNGTPAPGWHTCRRSRLW